jgi:hypothetical protein
MWRQDLLDGDIYAKVCPCHRMRWMKESWLGSTDLYTHFRTILNLVSSNRLWYPEILLDCVTWRMDRAHLVRYDIKSMIRTHHCKTLQDSSPTAIRMLLCGKAKGTCPLGLCVEHWYVSYVLSLNQFQSGIRASASLQPNYFLKAVIRQNMFSSQHVQIEPQWWIAVERGIGQKVR